MGGSNPLPGGQGGWEGGSRRPLRYWEAGCGPLPLGRKLNRKKSLALCVEDDKTSYFPSNFQYLTTILHIFLHSGKFRIFLHAFLLLLSIFFCFKISFFCSLFGLRFPQNSHSREYFFLIVLKRNCQPNVENNIFCPTSFQMQLRNPGNVRQ